MRISPSASHQSPAAARPARRAGVGASAAMPMKAGASAIVPSSGATTGTDHRRPARGRRNGTGAAAAMRTSAVPWRSASGEMSHAHRPMTRGQPSDAGKDGGEGGGYAGRGECREPRLRPECFETRKNKPSCSQARRQPARNRVSVLTRASIRRSRQDAWLAAAEQRAAALRCGEAHAPQRRRLHQAALVVQLALGRPQCLS